jgi:hypothetical protein
VGPALDLAALACAAFAALLGGLALAGWTLQIGILERIVPDVPAVKANTAVCYVLASPR